MGAKAVRSESSLDPAVVLEAVAEISDDAVLTCNAAGALATWSTPARRLFGCSSEEVLGQPLTVLFPPHLRRQVEEACQRALGGGEVRHLELEARRADGLPMPVSLSLCLVTDGNGRLGGLAVVLRDVTEQVLAQATLSELEEWAERAEALSHVGSWLWDVASGTVQWSAEMHRIHAVDPMSFGGTLDAFLRVMVPEDKERVRAAMLAAVEGRSVLEEEYEVCSSGGRGKLVLVRGEPAIGSDGSVVGLRGTGQEVSPRRPGRPLPKAG